MIVFIYQDISSETARILAIQKYEELFNTNLGGFSKNEKNKPILENGYISIAHTKNIVVIAISNKEIGIDIEAKNRVVKLENMTIKHWTEIEAYGKWKGVGVLKDDIYNEVPSMYLKNVNVLKEYYISVYSEDEDIFVLS